MDFNSLDELKSEGFVGFKRIRDLFLDTKMLLIAEEGMFGKSRITRTLLICKTNILLALAILRITQTKRLARNASHFFGRERYLQYGLNS